MNDPADKVRHLRITTDPDGSSRWATVDYPLAPREFAPPAAPFEVSAPIATDAALFYSAPPGWLGDWHPTPRVQIYVQLRGVLEVTTSDGDRRQLHPGTAVLLEDDTGTGHLSRVGGDVASEGLFVQRAPEGGPT